MFDNINPPPCQPMAPAVPKMPAPPRFTSFERRQLEDLHKRRIAWDSYLTGMLRELTQELPAHWRASVVDSAKEYPQVIVSIAKLLEGAE